MENSVVKINVLEGEDTLARIAEYGEQTKNAWIFIKEDAIANLRKLEAIEVRTYNSATYNYGGRIVKGRYFTDEWKILDEVTIGAGIDEFKTLPENPERIFIVEMAK